MSNAMKHNEDLAFMAEEEMDVIIITDDYYGDIEVVAELDDLALDSDVIVIDGDVVDNSISVEDFLLTEHNYDVSVDDMLFDMTAGDHLMGCGVFGTKG